MWGLTAHAQYRGGTKSGYQKTSFSQLDLYSAFTGGLGQGYFKTTFIQSTPNIYSGGTADGYANTLYAQPNASGNIYAGGSGSGYVRGCYIQSNDAGSNIFAGGSGSGYVRGCYIQSNGAASNIFAGGTADGYDKGCYAQSNLPKPVVKFSASDTTICVGACISFTDNSDYAPTSWKWTFTGASITTSTLQNVTNVCYLTAGSYQVKLRATNALGVDSLTKVAYITVYALPTLTMTPTTQSICTGATATLGASLTSTPGTVTYAWTGTNLITNSGASVTANPTTLTNYSVTATDATSGCARTGNTQVNVNGLPTVNASATSLTICEGSSTQLSASGGSTYTWNNGAGSGSPVTVAPITNTTYTVTGANGNGCTSTAQVSINVNPAPNAVITPQSTTTFCIGGNVQLVASGGTGYSWSPGTSLSATNIATVTASPTSSLTYTVTVAGANTCTKTASILVTVNQLPNVGVSTPSSIVCTGNSTTLNASGAATYSWNNAGTLSASTGASVTASPTIATTYTVTGTSAAGCSNTAQQAITVNTIPNVSVNTSAASICVGSSATLTASGATNYSWSPSTGLNTTVGASVIASPTSNQTYIVTGSNTGVGCSATAQQAIVVNTNPTVSATQDGTILCPGGTIMLHSATANGNTYQWYLNGTPIFNATSTDYGATVAGNYYVVVANGNSCTGQSNTLTLQGAAAAQAVITPASATTFCAGGSVTLNANTSTGLTYQWYKDGNAMIGSTTSSITASTSGFYTVDVTLNLECTTTSNPTQVVVNPYALATATAVGATTFCSGGAVTINANTGGSLTYDWRRVGTSGPLSFAVGISVGVSGTYFVVVNNQYNCASTSNSVVVNVQSLPTATATAAGSTNLCPAQTVVLNSNTGSGLSYQWKLNGNDISSQTASSYTVSATGNYSVLVTDANTCSNTSSTVGVTVNSAPPASISSPATAVCAGGSITLSANTGAGLTYQWKLNGNDIASATASSYSATATGNYTCVVTLNGLCNATSNAIAITVNPNPAPVISNTTPLTFCAGSTVILQTTTAANQSYQWYETIFGFGTFPINGQTGTTLQQGATNATFVYVTNTITGCNANSNPITPAHFPSPTASITNASNTTICSGSTVTLNSSVTGSGISYQWKLNGNDISLATANAYAAGAQGSYTLQVTNSNSCTTTSNAIGVTVNTTPAASISQTSPQNICTGANVTLNANTGAGLTHQWKLNGNDIAGETNSSYSANAAGNYTVVVTLNAQCSATSSVVVVNVNALPTASVSAGGATTFCSGNSVTLSANTGANLSYQWYVNSIGYNGFLGGQTASTLGASNDGSYYVVVYNSATNCSNTSNAIVVTNYASPGASIAAVGNTTICSGNSVTLNASTSNGTSYVWKLNGNTISGATNTFYAASVAGNYTVLITNSNACTSLSNAIGVTVNTTPLASIGANSTTTFCQGSSVLLSANTGAGITHQWQLNGSDINGETNSTYSANATGNYTCVTTLNGNCSATSNTIAVTVNANPTATLTANGATTFCDGNSVTLQANSGSGFTYQFYNTNYFGGEPVVSTSSINVTTSGTYGVRVYNPSGCTSFATTVPVIVNALPNVATSASGNTNICPGGNVTLNVTNIVNNTYQWYKNTVIVNTATNHDYIANTAGNYTCVVTGANGCTATSAAISVYVNDGSSAHIYATGSLNFCAGGAVTLHANWGTGLTHQWYRNASVIIGATDSTYIAIQTGIYTCAVTLDNNCVSVSNNLNVDANNGSFAVITPAYSLSCLGDSLPMSANTGLGFTYVWKRDGNVIVGAISSNYTALVNGNYTVTISNGVACSNTSVPTSVQLNTAPDNVIHPNGPLSFCQGGQVILRIDNSPNQTYQWFVYTGITFGWQPMIGANDSTLTINYSGSFYATISNLGGCNVTTNAVSISPVALPAANFTTSGNTNICPGFDVTFFANTGGGLTYQWNLNNAPIANAIQSSYAASTAGNYTVTVSNSFGCSTTSTVRNVYVNGGSSAHIYATNPTTFCAGGGTLLHANFGQGLTHQWYYNGSPITGATDSLYTATQQGFYNCQLVLDNNCTSVSNIINVSVNAAPNAAISITGSITICNGQTATLTAATGTGYSYQWLLNGNVIPLATTNTYGATASGAYSVVVTNGGCSATSNTIGVTVNTVISAVATAISNTTFCAGGNAQINANTGVGYNYQWYNGVNIINGATTSTYSATSGGSYKVVVSNSGGCSTTSNNVVVTVNANPTTPTIGGASSFCPTSSTTLNAGSGYTTYAWSGASSGNSQTLAITQPGTYTIVVTNSNSCSASNSVAISNCGIGAQGMFPVNQCGYLNQIPTGYMKATPITGAISYKFEFYAVGSNTVLATKIQSGVNLYFEQVTAPATGTITGTPFNWATQYDVTVTPTMTGDIIGTASNKCRFGFTAAPTPSNVPATSLKSPSCQSNIANASFILPNAVITCNTVSPASAYEFMFVNQSDNSVITAMASFVNQRSLAPLGLTTGATYAVSARAKIYGVWAANFGPVCYIKIQAPSIPQGGRLGLQSTSVSTTSRWGGLEGLSVSVFPNPFSSEFTLNISSAKVELVSVVITDITGKEVYSQKANTNSQLTINDVQLQSGVYFVSVRSSDGSSIVRKIVKTN